MLARTVDPGGHYFVYILTYPWYTGAMKDCKNPIAAAIMAFIGGLLAFFFWVGVFVLVSCVICYTIEQIYGIFRSYADKDDRYWKWYFKSWQGRRDLARWAREQAVSQP